MKLSISSNYDIYVQVVGKRNYNPRQAHFTRFNVTEHKVLSEIFQEPIQQGLLSDTNSVACTFLTVAEGGEIELGSRLVGARDIIQNMVKV